MVSMFKSKHFIFSYPIYFVLFFNFRKYVKIENYNAFPEILRLIIIQGY